MKEQADPSSDKADQTGNVQTGCQNEHRNKPWCPRTGAWLTPAAVTRPCGGCAAAAWAAPSCPGRCPPCPACPSALPKLPGSSAPASLWLPSAALAQLSLCPDVPALCAPPLALSPFPRPAPQLPCGPRSPRHLPAAHGRATRTPSSPLPPAGSALLTPHTLCHGGPDTKQPALPQRKMLDSE